MRRMLATSSPWSAIPSDLVVNALLCSRGMGTGATESESAVMELLLLLEFIQHKEVTMWQYILYFHTIAERDKAVTWIRANYEMHSDSTDHALSTCYTFYRVEKLDRDQLLMLVNSVQATNYLENEL